MAALDNAKSTMATLWTSCTERWPSEVEQTIQTTRRLADAQHVAVMPDVHLAHGFCIGTVLATRHLVYPSAVGNDIGCGMLALPFESDASAITEAGAHQLLRVLPRLVPASRQQQALITFNTDRPRLSHPWLDRVLCRDGAIQLGTLGSGNHFVELQRDTADGRLWLMVHSGSRGLGQAVSTHHLRLATQRSHGRAYLDVNTPGGLDYLNDLRITRAYARLNRVMIARALAFALKQYVSIEPDWTGTIHTGHNHARHERVGQDMMIVHRKGAAPALAGQISLIPGSMGTPSYHVIGLGHGGSLSSSSHGAGRRMDRATARRRISAEAMTRSMSGVWFNRSAAHQMRDESPQAYKDIDAVIAQQRDQVRVLRKLFPILSYKGS